MNRSYVLQAFLETPWAILPSKLALLEEIMMRHVNGEHLTIEEIQARIGDKPVRDSSQQVKSVAVLPLFGTIVPRADLFSDVSGATSAEGFGRRFSALLDDPEIGAIVLDVDSPGGQVGGIQEAADRIFEARGKKPIVAVANHMMASAAYWIGSAADELVVTPSGEVGSIGVFAAHRDVSAALEKDGVKMTLISAGKYKVQGNPYQALDDEARAAIQTHVDETYDLFVGAVARNRGVDATIVKSNFGEGRMIRAQQAVDLGMADRVETLDATINRLFNTITSPAGQANPSVNVPRAESTQADEGDQDPGSSNQESVKPDPRKVEKLRNYLKVYGPKNKEK